MVQIVGSVFLFVFFLVRVPIRAYIASLSEVYLQVVAKVPDAILNSKNKVKILHKSNISRSVYGPLKTFLAFV